MLKAAFELDEARSEFYRSIMASIQANDNNEEQEESA